MGALPTIYANLRNIWGKLTTLRF